MKLIMENWRNFRRECEALSEASYPHSTGSLESEFPEEKMIEDSFKLIDKYAPQFIKNSPYLKSVRFSRSESPTADKNSDGHMKGLLGKFTQDTIKPAINYIEVAFEKESPRAYLQNITQWLASRGASRESYKGAKSDSAPFKGPDDLIFINLNAFIRGWALHVKVDRDRPWAYSHWLVKMAGTIVHEVAHAEDKNHPKFQKFINNKMLDRLKNAIDDGLFDRELYDDAWPFKSVGNSGKKAAAMASAMDTFKEYLTQDLEALVTPMMTASEIYAYDTEIDFYSSVERDRSLHSRLRISAGITAEDTKEQKNNIVNKKYEKYTLSKTSDGT